MDNDKVLTLVIGWNLKSVLNDDICEAARKIGWKAQTVTEIDKKDLAENKLDKYFSDYVLWRRSLLNASDYENNRVWHWLNRCCNATMNTHVVGLNTIPVDKYFQHGVFSLDARLKDYVLPMYMVDSREDVDKLLLAGRIKFPFVMKDRFGTAGRDIVLFASDAEMDVYTGKWQYMAVEPYVEADCDWRVFVIGGTAIGIMRKTGDPDNPRDFRAKSGGIQKFNEEDQKVRDELIRIASDVASAMHLEYAGVDVIQDRNTGKYYIMEVNLAAGWMNGFSQITGADVAMSMARWFEARRELKHLPVAEAMRKYVENRLDCVTTETRRKYKKIMMGEDISSDGRVGVPVEGVSDGMSGLIGASGLGVDMGGLVETGGLGVGIGGLAETNSLAEKLRWLYEQVVLHKRGGELGSEGEWVLKYAGEMILKEAERQVSWAGNYVGADMLEDGVVNTAYYLMTKEALR